jgi:hypothetical protein
MTGTKKNIGMSVAGIVLVFFIAGCVSEGGNRGKVTAQPRGGEQVSIQQLTDGFVKYKVYYSGTKPADAVSVLFCPKDTDKTLSPDRWWNIVEDQKALSNIVSWMRTRENLANLSVQFVMGPNSQVFGYVYTFNYNTRVQVVSDKEMIVYAPVH